MMTTFPYKDPAQALQFALGYFDRLQADVDIRATWLKLRAIVQLKMRDPDIQAYVDTRSGTQMQVRAGVAAEPPNVVISLTADVFHQIYTGQMNVIMAFATGKIKTRGNTGLVMRTTWTLPAAIRIYRDYLKEIGVKEEKGGKEIKLPTRQTTVSGERPMRLKDRFLHGERQVCIERARYLTESYRRTEGQPAALRQARALRHILNQMTIHIAPDELLVGGLTGKSPAAAVYPECAGQRILGELPTLETRQDNPFHISPEERRELEEMLLYWHGKTLEDYARSVWPPQVADCYDKIAPFILTEIGGIAHQLLNHEKVLQLGLEKIVAEARRRRGSAAGEQADFYEAVEEACIGVIEWAGRYAAEAGRQAQIEVDPQRKIELERITGVCQRVPAMPARTLQEALQTVLFVHYAAQMESYVSAISPGRIDQFLHPYYAADLAAGRLDRKAARELLECFYIKLSESLPLFDSDATVAFSGLTAWANTVIGGTDANGLDATNDLSYLALEAMERMRTPQPNFGVRLHANTPPEFRNRVCQAVAGGIGNLQIFNDEAVIGAMIEQNIPPAEARTYGIIGCVEPAVPGCSFTSSDAALFNMGLCLELALNDGCGRIVTEPIGPATGDPRSFASMDDVVEAYRRQVAYLVRLMIDGLEGLARVHAEHKPTPFVSAFTDDCLAQGKDVTAGGARYNFTGPQGVGTATVGDSLAAIDQLVFREKRVTMEELLRALDDDFEGQEPLRQLLINHAPKYGNDDDRADAWARLAAEIYCQEVGKYPSYRGGRYQPGLYSVTMHIVFGLLVGATPDGRHARTTLSPGVSPAHGRDQHGPTAALRSASKLNQRLVGNGLALNQRINPKGLAGPHGAGILDGLLGGYLALGGMQLQWEIVDRATLLAAQERPEEYRDLVVRVAGYSALFTDLSRAVQDEMINRMEHEI